MSSFSSRRTTLLRGAGRSAAAVSDAREWRALTARRVRPELVTLTSPGVVCRPGGSQIDIGVRGQCVLESVWFRFHMLEHRAQALCEPFHVDLGQQPNVAFFTDTFFLFFWWKCLEKRTPPAPSHPKPP